MPLRLLKVNSSFDYFGVGDLVAVFFVSELSARVRVIGFCTAKSPSSRSFEIFTKGEVTYKFLIDSPNLVRIYNLKARRAHL